MRLVLCFARTGHILWTKSTSCEQTRKAWTSNQDVKHSVRRRISICIVVILIVVQTTSSVWVSYLATNDFDITLRRRMHGHGFTRCTNHVQNTHCIQIYTHAYGITHLHTFLLLFLLRRLLLPRDLWICNAYGEGVGDDRSKVFHVFVFVDISVR